MDDEKDGRRNTDDEELPARVPTPYGYSQTYQKCGSFALRERSKTGNIQSGR